MTGDFVRYLKAKRTVDDRAMNRRVWERLVCEARARSPHLRVVEVGAGIGTGLTRMIEWGLFEGFTKVNYLAVEPVQELVPSVSHPDMPEIEVRVVTTSLEALEEDGTGFDLVVAHAVLDILELEPSLDRLTALAAPGGLLYFPITFDGETIWEPALEVDDAIMEAYHGTMRRKGRTGRLLLHALARRGVEVLDAASSDWLVRPRACRYPDDEAFFLQYLLDTVQSALGGWMESPLPATWLTTRRRQLENGELVLIAHQLDVLGKRV